MKRSKTLLNPIYSLLTKIFPEAMKAYISVSYSKRKHLEKEISGIVTVLAQYSIESFVFVDKHCFSASDEKEMMQRAMTDIACCDLLIAETSEKAIGVGIEVGYAKAKGLPIIYLRNKDAEHSTTVSGISDYHIVYKNEHDLTEQLSVMMNRLKK